MVIWKENDVLNCAPAPSGINVVENAEPDWPTSAGVRRNTPAVQAALPLTCRLAQLLKSAKLKIVAAWF